MTSVLTRDLDTLQDNEILEHVDEDELIDDLIFLFEDDVLQIPAQDDEPDVGAFVYDSDDETLPLFDKCQICDEICVLMNHICPKCHFRPVTPEPFASAPL